MLEEYEDWHEGYENAEKDLGIESQRLKDLQGKGNNPQSKWSELKKN